jgi:CheY-like chemotaxis protein
MPKILLVEDNEMNRDMLSRRLEKRGYTVVLAVDGAAGIAQTKAEKPDLILMDMSLPVIDGWEATKQIRSDPEVAGTPIIALTAHAMSSDREKCLEAGCDDFDTKPVELPRLLAKIEEMLKKGRTPPA